MVGRSTAGKDAIGQSALLARRLVEAGSRFVTAAGYHSNSWDTHSDNDKGHRDRLSPPLDRTLTALIDDLDERGLLDTTLVRLVLVPATMKLMGSSNWWMPRVLDRLVPEIDEGEPAPALSAPV